VSAAARLLGMGRNHVARKARQFGLVSTNAGSSATIASSRPVRNSPSD
jgi:hypothetical protein